MLKKNESYFKESYPSSDLKKFIINLGNSIETFRYFNNRPLSVVFDHTINVLLYDSKNNPIGYGHIEYEDGVYWLGVCVIEKEKGKGFGKKILQYLIHKSEHRNIKAIRLSVDKNNIGAIRLYNSFGFKKISENDSNLFLDRLIKDKNDIPQ